VVRLPLGLIALSPYAFEEEYEAFIVRSLAFDQDHELGPAVRQATDIAGSMVSQPERGRR